MLLHHFYSQMHSHSSAFHAYKKQTPIIIIIVIHFFKSYIRDVKHTSSGLSDMLPLAGFSLTSLTVICRRAAVYLLPNVQLHNTALSAHAHIQMWSESPAFHSCSWFPEPSAGSFFSFLFFFEIWSVSGYFETLWVSFQVCLAAFSAFSAFWAHHCVAISTQLCSSL